MFMPQQFDHPSQHFLASARPGDTMTLPLHHEKPMTRWSECFWTGKLIVKAGFQSNFPYFPWFFHHPQPPPPHLLSWVSKGVPRYISCHSPTCVTGGLVEGANRLAARIFSTLRLGLWHPTEADVPWIFRARWRDGMALNREFLAATRGKRYSSFLYSGQFQIPNFCFVHVF